ncbi:BLOC-1-related complex subunit 5 [Hydra vulgaris]|nr:BLOC-1-related complex subunit 5 [Hydra vulgaris]
MGQEQSNISTDGSSVKKKEKAKLEDIIVVSKVDLTDGHNRIDDDLNNLKKIKFTKPVLNLVNTLDYSKLPHIVSGPLTEVVLRYQLHLTECAEAVAFDQNSISVLIKEVEVKILELYKSTLNQQRYMEKAIEQIENVNEITKVLAKVEINLTNSKKQFKMLNNLLPVEEQIIDSEFLN